VSLTGLGSYGGSLPTLLAEPIMNRPKTVRVLDCALDSCIRGSQVTIVSLHLDLSRQYTCWTAMTMAYLGDNPEVLSLSCIGEFNVEQTRSD